MYHRSVVSGVGVNKRVCPQKGSMREFFGVMELFCILIDDGDYMSVYMLKLIELNTQN